MHDFLRYELTSSLFFFRTDRQTDRQKAMHRSQLCISTGGLKNKTTMIPLCSAAAVDSDLTEAPIKVPCLQLNASYTRGTPEIPTLTLVYNTSIKMNSL